MMVHMGWVLPVTTTLEDDGIKAWESRQGSRIHGSMGWEIDVEWDD